MWLGALSPLFLADLRWSPDLGFVLARGPRRRIAGASVVSPSHAATHAVQRVLLARPAAPLCPRRCARRQLAGVHAYVRARAVRACVRACAVRARAVRAYVRACQCPRCCAATRALLPCGATSSGRSDAQQHRSRVFRCVGASGVGVMMNGLYCQNGNRDQLPRCRRHKLEGVAD